MEKFVFVLCLVAHAAAGAGRLQSHHLTIKEADVQFNETIYIDKGGNYEIIKVPKHRHMSGLTIFHDYNKGYSIYKVEEVKRCYVVRLDPEIESPEELESGLKKFDSKFPYHKYTIEVDNFFIKSHVNPMSTIGKTAGQLCKKYEVFHATIFRGGDIDEFAINTLKKAIGDENEKREAGKKKLPDRIVRDFYTCNKKESDYAMSELSRCKGQLNFYHANCKFSTSACVYRVQCPYDTTVGYWKCKGVHKFHNMVCCTYKCSL